jgi:hypothetical protein
MVALDSACRSPDQITDQCELFVFALPAHFVAVFPLPNERLATRHLSCLVTHEAG